MECDDRKLGRADGGGAGGVRGVPEAGGWIGSCFTAEAEFGELVVLK